MSAEQIVSLVSEVTGVTMDNMQKNTPTKALFARYVSISMLNEAGYQPADIAPLFGIHRTNVYSALKTIDDLLRLNKPFKTMYLDCIGRRSELEDAA